MTDQQKADLKTRGWTTLIPGQWRSPLTGRDYTDREALTMLALPDYRNRRRYTTPHLRRTGKPDHDADLF